VHLDDKSVMIHAGKLKPFFEINKSLDT